ncbi:pyridoxal phosphate-dependent aminotransferase [Breznakiella homolactica]|uniref:Histidinol-phosphate aminotransferase n=1 Tax=Breznakiella homolactica TaxID=2798577 RepID=A0A7T7XQG4_9SPIR|nr:histidinol-phosphate transaminase [Breznakiella homolactica]QQO10615.1 aminotransferase class I/II-fold pyridoxal phosphate-dependent enzyme [Breznakiella homolactica]
MSRFWNRRVRNLEPYVPGEQPRDRQYIKLNTNENPYPPSPAVFEAIHRAASDSLRLYPDPECTEFREAAARACRVKPEWVFAGNGSDEILAFVFAAFFESSADAPGEPLPILFPDITYSFYPVYAGLWDIPAGTIPLTGDFSVNVGDYLVPSGGVILPNPNAPTGKALAPGDLVPLAEYLLKQGKALVIDEAYVGFGAESAVALTAEYPNLLTVHTLSKSHSLAGLRTGFAIGHPDLVEGLRRVRDSFNSYTLDRLALAGAAAALGDNAYYDEVNRKVAATRDRVSRELRDMGFSAVPSSANFIFIKAPGLPGKQLHEALRSRGILVRHFNKPRTADYLRVSIGTDDEMDIFLSECRKLIRS